MHKLVLSVQNRSISLNTAFMRHFNDDVYINVIHKCLIAKQIHLPVSQIDSSD